MRGIRKTEDFAVLERQRRFQGAVISVDSQRFRLPTGVECTHDVLNLPDVVSIVPLLRRGEALRVVMLEQLRNAVEGFLHEIPAGCIEDGEEPLACARRELREETGYDAHRWTHLSTRLTIPGLARQRMHYFLAEDLELGESALEDSECLEVREIPLSELAEEIIAGPTGEPRVLDAKTHIGILDAALLRLDAEQLEAIRSRARSSETSSQRKEAP